MQVKFEFFYVWNQTVAGNWINNVHFLQFFFLSKQSNKDVFEWLFSLRSQKEIILFVFLQLFSIIFLKTNENWNSTEEKNNNKKRRSLDIYKTNWNSFGFYDLSTKRERERERERESERETRRSNMARILWQNFFCSLF